MCYFGAFLHHIAELAGYGQLSIAVHAGGFNKQDVSAHGCVEHAGGNTDLVLVGGVLGVNLGTSEQLGDLLQGSANLWSAGGEALGPIFTGGAISGQVRASEAVQRQALVGYLQTVQTAFREVDDALVNVQKSREQLAAEGRRVAALAEYARLAKLRYDEGYASYIEVLDAQRFLFDAKLQYVAVQGDVYASLIGTYKAMGGGWIIEAQR